MLISILLLLSYLVIFSFIISRSAFLHAGGLTTKFLLGYFYFSSAIGLAHVYMAYQYFPGHGDIWQYFEEGLWVREQIMSGNFFGSMHVVPESGGILDSDSGLNKFQYRVLALIQMGLSFLSFKNNYISTVIFGFFLLYGKLALFNGFRLLSDEKRKWAGLAFLLIPSVIFWTTVIHKEGLIFILLGILVYQLGLLNRFGGPWRWLIVLLCIAGIFLLRNFLAPILVASLVIGLIARLPNRKIRWMTGGILLAIISLSFYIFSGTRNSILSQVAKRQAEFLSLEGNSRMDLEPLSGNFYGVLQVLPDAFKNGFFLPYPGQFPNILYSFFGLELYVILLVMLIGLIVGFRNQTPVSSPVFWGVLVFAVAGILVIGFIIPFAGALVRYRSLYLPFLLFAGLIHLGFHRNPPFLKHIIKF